jgi:hypothetical protein
MVLTQSQRALIERSRAAGGGELATGLSDEACTFIVATIVRDLQLLHEFPEIGKIEFSEFFDEPDPRKLEIPDVDFYRFIERLFEIVPDADTYFACLATLQKSRLKFTHILEHQPIPTMDQVGPRALLQFGQMSPRTLAVFLLWRKWIFDIDNRSGQETGYLFEPIIAHAIGGASFSSNTSPIKRHRDQSKGRQVDCIRQRLAYEIKIRVTIAASGQGRWQEELDFPVDCRQSGFKPVLIVLDPTPNPKLSDLVAAFEMADGETYVGDAAWHHLEAAAGRVMGVFIDKYVKAPIQRVLDSTPGQLPDIIFRMTDEVFSVSVEKEIVEFKRTSATSSALESVGPESGADES